jgi:hypothetical protein
MRVFNEEMYFHFIGEVFLYGFLPFDTRLGSLYSFFFCLAPFTMYQKPAIDHTPWPSSQFNK